MQKIRYELDPYNRIVTGLPEFRKVVDGRFNIDEGNILSYHVKAPLSEIENIPNQLRLKGEWSLTDNYDLRLTVDKSARETFGDQITLQGEILDVNENTLLFAVTAKTDGDKRSTYVLNLEGSWKADKFNRLLFHVKKEAGKYDILTFNGAWEIDKNHQIIYRYEKAELIKKKKRLHTLTFKGYWDIKDKFRISYILDKSTGSVFDFQVKASAFRGDYIEYELGIGLADKKALPKKTLTLSGEWKLKKDVGLIFEIVYENKKIRAIVFGADAALTGKGTISFRLKDNIENKDIGIKLELSRNILNGDGEAFLRLLSSRRESAIYAGAAWRW